MSLFNHLRKPKDDLLSSVIKPILQSKLSPYGTMTALNINSAEKSIHLTLDLKGESSPIEIHIRDYEILNDRGESAIRIGAIETSRDWVNQLIKSYLPEEKKTIVLPSNLATAASILL